MIEREGARLIVKVPLVMANARALLEAGRLALQPGEQVFDFSVVTEADSSALAVMLGWLRAAIIVTVDRKICPYSNGCALAGGFVWRYRVVTPRLRALIFMAAAVSIVDVVKHFGSLQALAGVSLELSKRVSFSVCLDPMAPVKQR
jgi:hypothetical protein